MASIISRPNGRKEIHVCLLEDRRPVVRLGKATMKVARVACDHVEHLANALRTASPIESATAD